MGTLRLFLALAVINSHVEPQIIPTMLSGGDAVHLFFVISGFYMALILSRKYHSPTLFYSNRFLRLYPTYALVLLGTITWFYIAQAYTGQYPPPTWPAVARSELPIWQWLAVQFTALSMMGQDILMLFHWKSGEGFIFLIGNTEDLPSGAHWAGQLRWLGQTWTISIEIWFYFLAPFLVLRSVALQLILAAASFSLLLTPIDKIFPLTYFSFPTNFWLFLVGSVLFRFHRSGYFLISKWPGRFALGYVLVSGCLVGAAPASGAAHTIALLLIALNVPFLFQTFGNTRWDSVIGNLSYPVYLVHGLIADILFATYRIHSGLVIATTSVLVAILLVHFVENPIDVYRQRRASRVET